MNAQTAPAAAAVASGTQAPKGAEGLTQGAAQKGTEGAQPGEAQIRKLKLKLNGQETELSEAEVIALAQQSGAAAQRFDQAAQMRKEAEAVIKFAKENPREFFAKTGMNAREWAEQYLMEELKREQMSPEQRKAAENEEKLRKLEDEKKQAEEAKRQEEIAALEKQHAQRYDVLFTDALQKCGLPKTPFTVKRMAELQLVNVRKKLELTADQLAKVVREDYAAEQKALFGAYDGDQLMEYLGPEALKKLSKAQIAKLKAKSAKAMTTTKPQRSYPSPEGSQGLTWQEYRRRNRRLT